MRYSLCLIPPLAVLSCGKVGQFFLNFILTLFFYIPGVIHAVLVVNKYYADRRHKELIQVIEKSKT